MKTTAKPEYDMGELFPELKERTKVTVRLHPRRGNEPAVNESKFGGLFLWSADEPFPICDEPEYSINQRFELLEVGHPEHNDYYVPVLQIRAQDFPEMVFPEGKDLFQLFWCPRDHNSDFYCAVKVFWRKADEIKNRLVEMPKPKLVDERLLPQLCHFNPERVVEYPNVMEMEEELWEKIKNWDKITGNEVSKYDYYLSVAKGTKIGGYVSWIQSVQIPVCECANEMEHLLTVASWEYDGLAKDNRWCPMEDKPLFKEEFYVFEEDEVIRNAIGIMLGDAGSLYLFVCHHCKDFPISWVFQCS